MRTGRPKKPLELSAEEREQLEAIASSRSLPHGLVRRVKIVLLSAEAREKKAEALTAGATGCIDKPFLPTDILDKVAEILGL